MNLVQTHETRSEPLKAADRSLSRTKGLTFPCHLTHPGPGLMRLPTVPWLELERVLRLVAQEESALSRRLFHSLKGSWGQLS